MSPASCRYTGVRGAWATWMRQLPPGSQPSTVLTQGAAPHTEISTARPPQPRAASGGQTSRWETEAHPRGEHRPVSSLGSPGNGADDARKFCSAQPRAAPFAGHEAITAHTGFQSQVQRWAKATPRLPCVRPRAPTTRGRGKGWEQRWAAGRRWSRVSVAFYLSVLTTSFSLPRGPGAPA